MSIATDQKVEALLERVKKLEEDNAQLRQTVESLKLASKDPNGFRPSHKK